MSLSVKFSNKSFLFSQFRRLFLNWVGLRVLIAGDTLQGAGWILQDTESLFPRLFFAQDNGGGVLEVLISTIYRWFNRISTIYRGKVMVQQVSYANYASYDSGSGGKYGSERGSNGRSIASSR